jgi:uncharacterized protein YjbI with pentapeptide repeats
MTPLVQTRLWKKGANAWNTWRKRHPKRVPDLSGIRISYSSEVYKTFDGFNLADAYMTGAYFDGTDFKGADLCRVDAKGTEFRNSDFTGANIQNVPFNDCAFFFCKFNNADLRGTSFDRALLRHTELIGADLTEVGFGETELINSKLTKVKGLASIDHRAPSWLDLATLSQRLPLAFLRGIGLSDGAIDARTSLGSFSDAIPSCFISYSALDRPVAEKIYEDLQEIGVRCWFAPHDLPIGAKTLQNIDHQIAHLDKLLLILSANSLRSDWVEDEVSKAFAEERRRQSLVLMPIRIDDEVMTTKEAWALKLRDQRNIGDFRSWRKGSNYERLLNRLVRDLRYACPEDEPV